MSERELHDLLVGCGRCGSGGLSWEKIVSLTRKAWFPLITAPNITVTRIF